MLIYDDPLLRGQPPLSSNSPYPEGGFLMVVQLYLSIEKQYSFYTNPQVAMLSKDGFYYIYPSLVYSFFETSVSSKNNFKKKISTFPSPWVNSTDLPARNICEKEKGNELLPEAYVSGYYKILMFITFGSSYHCEVG